MDQVIAVVVENTKIKKQMECFLRDISGLEICVFSQLKDFNKWVRGKHIHALICEVKLLVQTTQENRNIVDLLSKSLVVARIKWDTSKDQLVAVLDEQVYIDEYFWEQIIILIKNQKQGRVIRKFDRKERNWNLEVIESVQGLSEKFFVTRDVSPGGLFVLSVSSPEPGTEIKIRIAELEDSTPIIATVRWVHPWGLKKNFPAGFGVQFEQVTAKQLEQIEELLGITQQSITLEEIEKLLDLKSINE